MRKRLGYFIGSDAYKVNIYTFHAFCNDVIQENLSLFDKNELDPISDLEKIELFKTLIDAFPKNHPLKKYRGDVYSEIKRLDALFSAMKREGWTPEFIGQAIDSYIADLPSRDGYIAKRATKHFKKGDLRTDKIEEAKEKMEKLRAAVNEFDRYQELMRKRNRYDFDDMINWVIRAFRENQQFLLNYQERYQYILVDEYQDTSGTQNALVQLLISYWDQPNIFVVGDDDQSIYRFQGANIENMERFAEHYAGDLFKVALAHNYRSTQPILDISKTLIDRNEERLIRNEERLIRKMDGLQKNLKASHPEISLLDNPPVILEYESQRREMIDITLRVEKLIAEKVEPGKIAVIFKENRFGEELIKFFHHRNIPAYSKRNMNLLDIPLSKKIIDILRYLAAEHDAPYGGDELLFEILHFDFFAIPPIEIAKLSVEVADKQFSEQKTSIRRLLYEKSNAKPRDLFDAGIPASLKQASAALEKLIADTPNVTLQTLVENLIRTTGVLNVIMQSADKLWLLQVLTALFDFIKEETRRNPDLTLKQLIRNIELMKANGVIIPLVQIGGSEKGVNLLTAHGSKGLEFEYVFRGWNSNMFFFPAPTRRSGRKSASPQPIFNSPIRYSPAARLRATKKN